MGAEMKLFLISQSHNNGYDTFDSAVVAAKDEDMARKILPGWGRGVDFTPTSLDGGTWADPEHVTAEYIGTAKPGTKAGTVICASFNAG
jgi:hypothetical protein